MFRSLIVLLIIVLSLYWYTTVATNCPAPLAYAIEKPIDERFSLSDEAAAAAVSKAETAWEEASGRELFYPATAGEKADVSIRFVFDDRQERVLAEESLRESLENKQHSSDEFKTNYDTLVKDYKSATDSYQENVEAYETRLSTYNQKVADYNAAGGAPAEVYEEMEATKAKLAKEFRTLETEATTLQKLADQLNELGEAGSQIVSQYNAGVKTYNKEFGEPDEFTQGDYQTGLISIYTFTDTAELEKVLTHEFGHALSLDHVEGTDSIMYYLLEDQPTPLALSANDVSTLVTTCGETGRFETRVRTLINRYIL